MEIGALEWIINLTIITPACYLIGTNMKQYNMARDWADSHPNCDISFYEDWIQNAAHFNILNYLNVHTGFLGRKIAYKLHLRNKS